MRSPPKDPWYELSNRTPARIALGRTGASLPTSEVLALAAAHAQARDAVHTKLDIQAIIQGVKNLGLETIEVSSDAADRALYLRRPDLGRRLSDASRERLSAIAQPSTRTDVALVIGDGLSAAAIHAHVVPMVAAFLPHINSLKLTMARSGWRTGRVSPWQTRSDCC